MAQMQQVTTMLMFSGQAEEAMNYYVGLFENSEIEYIEHYAPGTDAAGQVVHAVFNLNGQQIYAMDSAVEHPFMFTPSISFFVNCRDEAEIDRLAAAFEDGGATLMPLQSYDFATKYTWVQDRFGVSWQLMLA